MKKIETINEINLLEIFHTIMNNKKKMVHSSTIKELEYQKKETLIAACLLLAV